MASQLTSQSDEAESEVLETDERATTEFAIPQSKRKVDTALDLKTYSLRICSRYLSIFWMDRLRN